MPRYTLSIAILLLLISSCSVHTLHNYDAAAYEKLAQVKIGKIAGQDFYTIKQAFYQEFYSKESDMNMPKSYEVNLKFTDAISSWIVQSDSTILKNSLSLIATFELIDLKTKKIIRTGAARTLRIFAESPSAWSSYTFEKKVREEAIIEVLKLIKEQILTCLIKKTDENQSKRH